MTQLRNYNFQKIQKILHELESVFLQRFVSKPYDEFPSELLPCLGWSGIPRAWRQTFMVNNSSPWDRKRDTILCHYFLSHHRIFVPHMLQQLSFWQRAFSCEKICQKARAKILQNNILDTKGINCSQCFWRMEPALLSYCIMLPFLWSLLIESSSLLILLNVHVCFFAFWVLLLPLLPFDSICSPCPPLLTSANLHTENTMQIHWGKNKDTWWPNWEITASRRFKNPLGTWVGIFATLCEQTLW